MGAQEWIAFGLVALAGGYLFRRIYFRYLALPLSTFLLKRKKVNLAMKVRASAKKSGCGTDCSCD